MNKDRFFVRVWDKREKAWVMTGSERAFCDDYDARYIGANCDQVPQQCTGLKDKTGKLIYEGDIVKLDNGKIKEVFWNTVLYTLNDIGSSVGDLYGIRIDLLYNGVQDQIEIIGNIMEHGELLKEISE